MIDDDSLLEIETAGTVFRRVRVGKQMQASDARERKAATEYMRRLDQDFVMGSMQPWLTALSNAQHTASDQEVVGVLLLNG